MATPLPHPATGLAAEATPAVHPPRPDLPPPPVVSAPPIVGSVGPMLVDPIGFYTDMYREYGPAYRYRVVGKEFTVLAGADATVFMGSPEGVRCIGSKGTWDAFARETGMQSMLVAEDDGVHTHLRNINRQGFSAAVLRGRCPEVYHLVRHSVLRLRPGESFGLIDWVRRLICEEIGLLVVGRLPGDYFDDFLRWINGLLEVTVLQRKPRLFLSTPGYRKAKARTFEMARDLIAWHRDNPDRPDRDLIDALIEDYDDPDGVLDSEMDLLVAAVGPYVAGMDTVSNTLGFLMQELLRDPALMAEIREEVDEVLAAGPLTTRSVRKLDKLSRAVLETMRLHAVAPALPRIAREGFAFGGHWIAQGSMLQIATNVAHLDPALYPDPERFDIDRYLPERAEHKQPGAYAPFGAGPHRCLGRFLGQAQLVLTAAAMLHNADFEMDPATDSRKVVLDPLPSPGKRLRITVTRHRNNRLVG